VDWNKNQDWIRMLKNSKITLEQLTIAEGELEIEVMASFVLQDSPQKVGSRIFQSILNKTAIAQGYSLIVNVEAAAFHILQLLEKVSHSLTPVCRILL
jgi:hypothetical protein